MSLWDHFPRYHMYTFSDVHEHMNSLDQVFADPHFFFHSYHHFTSSTEKEKRNGLRFLIRRNFPDQYRI